MTKVKDPKIGDWVCWNDGNPKSIGQVTRVTKTQFRVDGRVFRWNWRSEDWETSSSNGLYRYPARIPTPEAIAKASSAQEQARLKQERILAQIEDCRRALRIVDWSRVDIWDVRRVAEVLKMWKEEQ